MKFKRVMAFVLASMLMMSSMTVFAASHTGSTAPDNAAAGDTWTKDDGSVWTAEEDEEGNITWNKTQDAPSNPSEPTTPSDPSESAPDSSTGSDSSDVAIVPCGGSVASMPAAPAPVVESAAVIAERAQAVALQAAASDEGFADVVAYQDAVAKNMSAGEYYNNAAVETPGIEEATPVAQGGGIIINGVVTNAMATISKVDKAFVDSVRASVEGTVLNVVDVSFPAVEATINFYMPGVAADTNVVAVQYVDGAWVDVEVAEVRADHVVLNLKQNGKVAFLSR